ncbi:MAG: hypothetical protein NTV50_10820 [Planctomycetota bacterium]|nr:hypothetical protein [Planctomycetota bacterium]
MESGNNKEIKHPFAIILAVTAGLLRLVPHYPNCTPIGAMTLFSGNKINGISSWLIPIGVMFITDLLLYFPLEQISLEAFSWMTPVIYGCYLVNIAIGRLITPGNLVLKLSLSSVLGSTLFFIFTNLAVWLGGDGIAYPLNLVGLLSCYEMAIPFYGYPMLTDLFFTLGIFGLNGLLERVFSTSKAQAKS